MKKKLLSLGVVLLSSLLFSGCATNITNLTPSTQKRNANALYPFEVDFDTSERCIQHDTLKPSVVIGGQLYPMEPAMMLKDRWETLIPVSPDKEYVNYRFKFDYDYTSIPHRRPGSILSRSFQLKITDNK